MSIKFCNIGPFIIGLCFHTDNGLFDEVVCDYECHFKFYLPYWKVNFVKFLVLFNKKVNSHAKFVHFMKLKLY